MTAQADGPPGVANRGWVFGVPGFLVVGAQFKRRLQGREGLDPGYLRVGDWLHRLRVHLDVGHRAFPRQTVVN